MKITALYRKEIPERTWNPVFLKELRKLGIPCLHANTDEWAPDQVLQAIRATDVLITDHGTLPVPLEVLQDRDHLRYICHFAGSIRGGIPRAIIEAGLPVTNWGDAPAQSIAEGAMTLLLAVLKEIPAHILDKRDGEWAPRTIERSGTLAGLPVGLFGLGAIGQRFVELIRPFQPKLSAFDPYVHHWPSDVERVDSLDELCARSFALVLHAGLSEETRHAIGATQLALLPDHGVVINTARGALIDHAALFRELESGRLRAGLDVLDVDGNDWLPKGHPALHWPNVIFTAHRVGRGGWPGPEKLPDRAMGPSHLVCLDNLRRFAAREPLRFQFDLARYDRST